MPVGLRDALCGTVGRRTVQVPLGAEWWAEPVEQPANRDTLATYDVDPEVLARWREARNEYLSARSALVGEIERQGWAPARQPPTSYVDIISTARPHLLPHALSKSKTTNAAASGTATGSSATPTRGCCDHQPLLQGRPARKRWCSLTNDVPDFLGISQTGDMNWHTDSGLARLVGLVPDVDLARLVREVVQQ